MKPLVGIIMGSDSDLTVMKDAQDFLDELDVLHTIEIVSAHRTTRKMVNYATDAKKKGVQVIIAGAGGAAHLPGMIASLTSLPVIGVPIKTKSLDGLDSLLSIAQMPPGVPVATMAINGAKNAAILACQILGVAHPPIAERIERYKKNLETAVLKKDELLGKIGAEAYLKRMSSDK
ncbi:MAG TPA: 5-(carboxyamino)imidazole ribonucleotide mutase [Nitrososphaera sp.]|nr:5-(carboxyamino)imidazole ribonucleotide mutase [Nitrososphaera sp.]